MYAYRYTMDLTGEQIKEFMEFSYGGWFNTLTGPEDDLIAFARDKEGKLIFNARYNFYDTVTPVSASKATRRQPGLLFSRFMAILRI